MNSVERGNLGYKPRTLTQPPPIIRMCVYPDAVNFQLDELRQVFILAVNIHHPTLLYSLQLSAGGIEDVPRIDYIARMQIVSELAQDKCVSASQCSWERSLYTLSLYNARTGTPLLL